MKRAHLVAIIIGTGLTIQANAATTAQPQVANTMVAKPPQQQTMMAQPAAAIPALAANTAQTTTTVTQTQPGPANPTTTMTITAPASQSVMLTTPMAKQSYAIGADIGHILKTRTVSVDLNILFQGMKDSFTGAPLKMSDQEISQTLTELQKEVLARQQAQMDQLKVKNSQEGDAFLAANKLKPGVVTLPSGLQYKVIQQGAGPQPMDGDKVVVNYSGMTIDGKEFDSSQRHGNKPVEFPLTEMIPGWVEALKLMKTGSTWEIYVPASLAYGDKGAPPIISPNQVLIFKINLVDVKKAS